MLALLVLSSTSLAEDAIPRGTILPVQLNSSIRSDKARVGDPISARIMQRVQLTPHSVIPAGAKVTGSVVAVRPASRGTGAEISFRFDTVAIGKQRTPVSTNLRAMASMMDVSAAQVPVTGPDRGTGENSWTTNQIGGEVNYHSGPIVQGSYLVGRSAPDGALGHPRSRPGRACRGDVAGNDRLQALWLFSSDACGLYDIDDVILMHAGRTDPVGEITLISKARDVNIRAGSGLLLRVNAPADVRGEN